MSQSKRLPIIRTYWALWRARASVHVVEQGYTLCGRRVGAEQLTHEAEGNLCSICARHARDLVVYAHDDEAARGG